MTTGDQAALDCEGSGSLLAGCSRHFGAQAKAILEKLPMLPDGDTALSQLVDLLVSDVMAGGDAAELVDGSWSMLMEGLGLA